MADRDAKTTHEGAGQTQGPPIIGLTGPNAAGKGEAARFLKEEGYAYHSLSDVVREEATARGLDHSRENLIRVGNELRQTFGAGVLAERILLKLRQAGSVPGEGPNPGGSGGGAPAGARGEPRASSMAGAPSPTRRPGAVVDSVRSPAEVAVLRRVPGFVLLGVDAPIALRFERASRRSRIGDGTTLEEFARKEALENSNDPAAQQLTQTLALADVVVPNDGTLEELRARVAEALHLG